MNETELLRAKIADKIRECEENCVATHTYFLDIASASTALSVCRKENAKFAFFGGYDDAERKICIFLPYYAEHFSECFDESNFPLCVFRVKNKNPAKSLSHRDFLGSLMSLGIKRELMGDILVYDGGADIIILSSCARFLAENFTKAGNCPVETSVFPISELRRPDAKTLEKRDTVASPRLDSIVSAAFDISRSAATEAIAAGLVFVNDMQEEKTDRQVSVGSKIVLRGKGKAVLREFRGESRKGRQIVVFDRYI